MYDDALQTMQARVADIHEHKAREQIWLLEHPPLYSAGTSAKPDDLVDADRFPVYETGRGGQYTYHGPGQRVGYVMLDLKARAEAAGAQPDIRQFVKQLEGWIIATLAAFDIKGELRDDRIGVWVQTGNSEKKIAALGIRVKHWVTCHGIAINICPDLSHFTGIVPCGIKEYGVTSLHDLGVEASFEEVDAVLKQEFENFFPTP
ncbi:MAG: lipoyl(octanoyl) transferase LipB [Rickettsiales bacterium]|nr:lipoyl(octanoyl) transferase LipB [Rickettsiales bacterium]